MSDSPCDHGSGASNTCSDSDGAGSTVLHASTTLHAQVSIGDGCLEVSDLEHAVWAHDCAHTAAVALAGIKSQSHNILQILKTFHLRTPFYGAAPTNLAASQRLIPAAPHAICTGTAVRISFFTPESDV